MEPAVSIVLDEQGVPEAVVEPRELNQAAVEVAPLRGMLGLENPGPRQNMQLKEIWDFFAEKAQGQGDLLYQFRQTENKMSPPRLGETRLSKMHTWVKLQREIKSREEHLNSL